MAIPKHQSTRLTIGEYLTLERASLERHEYYDGVLHQMAGESDSHGDITVNLVALVANQLKGTPCRARTKDTKVHSGPLPRLYGSRKGLFSYPDLAIIRGDVDHFDEHRDVVTNPVCIIEVVSPSTEKYDRDVKMRKYFTWNPTMTDYVLVSQDEPAIMHYRREPNGDLKVNWIIGLGETLELAAPQDQAAVIGRL